MPSAENLNMSVIVLLTGLVVVFAALIVLTFIIKGYGAAVTAVLNGKKKNVAEKAAAKPAPAPKAAPAVKAAPAAPSAPAVSDGIPGEVIAAIAAAVDYTFGSGTHVVRSVRRVPQNRSAWGSAGLVENTRPFLFLGIEWYFKNLQM